MSNYKNANRKEDEQIVEALLRLPVQNLESRIEELEREMEQRRLIHESIDNSLGALRRVAEESLWRRRYSSLAGGFQATDTLRQHLLQIESLGNVEATSWFRETSALNERLQLAKEELSQANERLKLMEVVEEELNGNSNLDNGKHRRNKRSRT